MSEHLLDKLMDDGPATPPDPKPRLRPGMEVWVEGSLGWVCGTLVTLGNFKRIRGEKADELTAQTAAYPNSHMPFLPDGNGSIALIQLPGAKGSYHAEPTENKKFRGLNKDDASNNLIFAIAGELLTTEEVNRSKATKAWRVLTP